MDRFFQAHPMFGIALLHAATEPALERARELGRSFLTVHDMQSGLRLVAMTSDPRAILDASKRHEVTYANANATVPASGGGEQMSAAGILSSESAEVQLVDVHPETELGRRMRETDHKWDGWVPTDPLRAVMRFLADNIIRDMRNKK